MCLVVNQLARIVYRGSCVFGMFLGIDYTFSSGCVWLLISRLLFMYRGSFLLGVCFRIHHTFYCRFSFGGQSVGLLLYRGSYVL